MDVLRDWFNRKRSAIELDADYAPLAHDTGDYDDVDHTNQRPPLVSMDSSTELLSPRDNKAFSETTSTSWFDYAVFLVLGVAMLWAWNCFLAAAAYFQVRFKESQAILDTFQPAIMTVSTFTTLLMTFLLSHMQKEARYPYRIMCALIINIVVFTLLALSTVMFTDVSAATYLAFTLLMVFGTAASAGFFQNGLFAYVGSFEPIYTQAVMAGQGLAGVLPAVVQVASVLAIPARPTDGEATESESDKAESRKSAFAYFLTAMIVCCVALLLFSILLSRHNHRNSSHIVDEFAEAPVETKDNVTLARLAKKIPLPGYAVFMTFAVTMAFPIFTSAILSVNSPTSNFTRPEVFIPLSFLIWNSGDLMGRVVCGFPKLTCTNPLLLAIGATSRFLFIPLYYLCNIRGAGAKIESDWFYWLLQVTFGFTNGYLGSNSMMVAPTLVDLDEISASGGYMGLCLVGGLAVGSASSFFLSI